MKLLKAIEEHLLGFTVATSLLVMLVAALGAECHAQRRNDRIQDCIRTPGVTAAQCKELFP